MRLRDIVNGAADWWAPADRDAVGETLSPVQWGRLTQHCASLEVRYFGAYRRTRDGRCVWEIRGDELAGALRTTSGGSSRQALVRAGRGRFDVRWMGVHEYAHLQGAETLRYDAVTERQALYALGDAVCVPVIEWIGEHWLTRLAL